MNFKEEIARKISGLTNLELETVLAMLEIPPDPKMGDFAFPCFQLSKTLRKAPPLIATDLLQKLPEDGIIEKVQTVGGYLNFFVNRNAYFKTVISDVLAADGAFGGSRIGNGKTVIVEFSSPNIAKPFHVGHLCSTVIGNSLEKIYRHLGYKTVKLNHLGDWGTQFGKLIVAYKKWGDEEAVNRDPIKELLDLYVKFHTEAEKYPALEDEAREYFKRLEGNDPEAAGLWEKFRKLSLKEFNRIYADLNITFDSFAGESFYSDKMQGVIELLEDKGLLTESENARVVNLDQFNIPPCIIVKSDGASIYATRDLAAALYRRQTYNFDQCIYVVGTPQALHFKQVFTVLELAGFDWAQNCTHVGFGLVKFADRKLSTRSGDVIFLEDVLAEAVKKVHEVINEKNPDLKDKDDVAKKVGIGSIVYTFLKNNRERDIVFSWEDTLDFNGETGPYVQYTYVRCRSILRKADQFPETFVDNFAVTDEEFELAKLLEGFKDAVLEAAARNEPSIVTRQIMEIAKAYNRFYKNCPILSVDAPNIKTARLNFTRAVSIVLQTGLGLLGIDVPENM